MWIDFKYSIIDSINLGLMIITTIIGTYYCYTKNKSGDNKDFITRFICLGVPVGIRIFVFAIPLFLLVGVVEYKYETGRQINQLGEEVYLTTINQVIVFFLYAIVCYVYLGKKLYEISQKSNA